MEEVECTDSFDCVNGSVIKQCYENNAFSEETFFCDCSNWFGWIGENCDKPGPTIYYIRITTVFFLAWTLFNIVTLSKTLFLLARHSFRKISIKDLNPIFYVVLFDTLASFGLLIGRLIESPSYFDSTQYEVNEIDFGSTQVIQVDRKFTFASNFAIGFSSLFLLFSSAIIILSWLEVFNKMNNIIKLDGFIYEKVIKKTIISMVIIITVVFIIFSSLNILGVVILIYSVSAVLLIIAYVVGYCRFRNRMISLLNGSLGSKEKKALCLVRNSCKLKVFCFSALLLFSIAFFFGFSNSVEILKVGGFNYVLLFLDATNVSALISITHTSYYTYSINEKLMKNAGSADKTSWFPFIYSCKTLIKSKKSLVTSDLDNNNI